MISRLSLYSLLASLAISSLSFAESAPEIKFNKLREMYAFYYLPFNVKFKVGAQVDDVFPVVPDAMGALSKVVSPDDMKKLEKDWSSVRETWKKRSLFLATPVDLGKTIRISEHLISHKIAVNRTALDHLSLSNKLALQQSLKDKSPEVQANVTQLAFVKSFMEEKDKRNFNFFIVSPSWCASSQEYRALFEAYFKKFPNTNITLHSIVVDDPEESIFESKIFKELFPHNKIYSHEIVPRFLAFEQKEGKSIIYEEGEALAVLYENHFKNHQGFLNKMANGILPEMPNPNSTNPFYTSSIATVPKMAE